MQNFFWFIWKAKKPADKSELEMRSKKDNDEKLALCRFMRIISNVSEKYQAFLKRMTAHITILASHSDPACIPCN